MWQSHLGSNARKWKEVKISAPGIPATTISVLEKALAGVFGQVGVGVGHIHACMGAAHTDGPSLAVLTRSQGQRWHSQAVSKSNRQLVSDSSTGMVAGLGAGSTDSATRVPSQLHGAQTLSFLPSLPTPPPPARQARRRARRPSMRPHQCPPQLPPLPAPRLPLRVALPPWPALRPHLPLVPCARVVQQGAGMGRPLRLAAPTTHRGLLASVLSHPQAQAAAPLVWGLV